MFNLEKILKTVSDRMAPIKVNSERCCRARSTLSKCSLCKDICPMDAIKIENKTIQLDNHCIECGLCATVCPTDALMIQEPTEINIYNKIQEIGTAKGTVVIGCRLNKEMPAKAINVPCLGGLSLAFLFAINTSTFPIHIVFKEKNCKNCSVKNGLEIYLIGLDKIKKLQEKLKINNWAVQHWEISPKIQAPQVDDEDVDNSRRNFFNYMLGEIKNMPIAVINEIFYSPQENSKTLKKMPKTMINRLKLLKHGLKATKITELSNKEILFFHQPYLQNRCYLCKACTMLCPVGALQYIEEKNTILLEENLCTGCGLCVDVCYYKGLNLEEKKAEVFKDNKMITLVKGVKKACKVCRKTMVADSLTETCFTCEKSGNNRKKDILEA